MKYEQVLDHGPDRIEVVGCLECVTLTINGQDTHLSHDNARELARHLIAAADTAWLARS